ncbi:MAG: 23S rRNA (uracil(1939)-C(5))-methyltransferase RlmD [Acidobacteriota bacterium]
MQCQHFGICGGCSLPGIPYATQLAMKQARLETMLGVAVPPVIPSPREDRFRHKVTFVFGSDETGRRIVMGHYAAGGRTMVPVEECPVHSDRGNQLAFTLRDQLTRARVSPDVLRHVLVRTTESGRQAVMMLIVSRNDRSLRRPIRQFLELAGAPDGFFVNINDRPGPFMVGRETIRIAGRPHVREDALGPAYLISPSAFFQTNIGSTRSLIDLVVSGVGDARRVLDLYSGSGLFTIPLALAGASVTAVEENAQANDDAVLNLRLNRVPEANVRLMRARAEDALARLTREHFDAVVIDPPRQGCAAQVLPAILQDLKPPRLVYVSCNPEVLADDLDSIRRAGYRINRLQPIDMFPHTDHIETVVSLTGA